MDDTQLDRIESGLKDLTAQQNKTNLVLIEQHLTLIEHTKRSQMLEDIVLPMQKKMTMVEGFLQGLGVLAVISGIIEVIVLLFRH
jgi:hypothetical protein